MRMSDFRTGWAVVGNDGRRLGSIKGVTPNFVIVRHGFGRDLYVPVSHIANVERETVHLNLTQSDALHMGWEQAPRDDEAEPEDDLHRHV